MTFSLWSGGELLGHAQLSQMTGIPTLTPAMNGPFLPSTAFADVWPVMEALQRCGATFFADTARIAPGVTPEEHRKQLLALLSPAGIRAYQDAESAVLALGLELRDEAGQAVPDVSIQVGEWQLFASLPDGLRMQTEAEATRQGISTGGYFMVVTRARPTTIRTDR